MQVHKLGDGEKTDTRYRIGYSYQVKIIVVPGGPKNPINIRRLPDFEQELAT